ncbi:hypothetical protein BH11GEM1_BH11GEM1_35760 [soil metagenome]
MRRAILVTCCWILAACLSPTQPQPPARNGAGNWVGTTSGVRVRFIMTEQWFKLWNAPGFYLLSGTGSIMVLATGDSLPFRISGSDQEGATGVSVAMEVVPTSTSKPVYGKFLGQLDAKGELVGSIDGTANQTVGPFKSSQQAVTLVRQ